MLSLFKVTEDKNFKAGRTLILEPKNERYALFGLLGLQLLFYTYYLFEVPLHYDEWHSIRHFSGDTFWTVMSRYPAPNNHVFYNLVAHLFLLTGLDAEIGARLPSLLASLVTSYFFYKVCRRFFGPLLSLLLLSCALSVFNVILYSVQARGYGFLNMFCVLMIYAALNLSEDYNRSKYRKLLGFSVFLGLYTVPSFLYAIAPVYLVLGFYVLKQWKLKNIWLLLSDIFVIAVVTILFYAIIIYNNDPDNLLKPSQDRAFSRSDPDAWERINFYVDTTFYELFDLTRLFWLQIILFVVTIYLLIKKRERINFMFILSVLLFFSPYLILLWRPVFPFGRNWLYLVFPFMLCLGFIVKTFSDALIAKPPYTILKRLFPLLFVLILLFCIHRLLSFGPRHMEGNAWDYQLSWLRKTKLAPELGHIKTIGYSNSGQEYYPAEMIMFFCYEHNRSRDVQVKGIGNLPTEDVLVIAADQLAKYRKDLLQYDFIYEHRDYWFYIRKHFKNSN